MLLPTPQSWKTPRWYSYIIAPFGWLWYAGIVLRRMLTRSYVSKVPVVCVGNHLAGGAGKTPCVIAMAKLLASEGKKVVCISKGYGGSVVAPVEVDVNLHGAEQVGDEPLLLARHMTVVVGKSRIAAIKLAEELSPDVILMDDGLQNPSIHKTLSVLLLNTSTPYWNRLLFPAGPCRERLSCAIARADIIVTVGKVRDVTLPKEKTISAKIIPVVQDNVSKSAYLAFAGIGYPEKFFHTAEKAGYHVIATQFFPDHHPYSNDEIEALLEKAKQLQTKLLTTEKDKVKIPVAYHDRIEVLPIELQWTSDDAMLSLLHQAI